jgi:hypothetical protein
MSFMAHGKATSVPGPVTVFGDVHRDALRKPLRVAAQIAQTAAQGAFAQRAYHRTLTLGRVLLLLAPE